MPTDTALLIIDYQYGLIESNPPAAHAAQVTANLNQAIGLARAAGMPVIFIQHDGTPDSDLPPGSRDWEIHPALARRPEDIVIHKTVGDSFYRPELNDTLRRLGVDKLWIGGSATDFCVDTAIRTGLSHNYQLTVLSDAHTCRDRPTLKAEQVIAHFNFVWSNMDETPRPMRVLKVAELA